MLSKTATPKGRRGRGQGRPLVLLGLSFHLSLLLRFHLFLLALVRTAAWGFESMSSDLQHSNFCEPWNQDDTEMNSRKISYIPHLLRLLPQTSWISRTRGTGFSRYNPRMGKGGLRRRHFSWLPWPSPSAVQRASAAASAPAAPSAARLASALSSACLATRNSEHQKQKHTAYSFCHLGAVHNAAYRLPAAVAAAVCRPHTAAGAPGLPAAETAETAEMLLHSAAGLVPGRVPGV